MLHVSGVIGISPHLDLSNQSHNAFPYVFAFTVGQTVKDFAAWRLQCGVRLGTLEQIMGSISVGGTLATHVLLRPFNGLAIGLAILWASSPLGNYLLPNLGQEIPEAVASNITITYLDTAQESFFYNTDFLPEVSAGGINALYLSGIIASRSAQRLSIDQWGNVKIPYYSRLDDNTTANASSWKHPPESGSVFSALLGIPISGLAATGNSTFTITTTYIDLDCYNISRGPPIVNGADENGNMWLFGLSAPSLNSSRTFFLAMNGLIRGKSGAVSAYANVTNGTTAPPTLLFQSIIWDGVENIADRFDVSLVKCRLRQEYVDSVIFCPGNSVVGSSGCHVTAMRPSSGRHAGSNVTILGLLDQFQMTAQLLPIATGENTFGFVAESTATELFMENSSLPFSMLGRAHLYNVAKSDLEVRLGQVLNTYNLASLAPFDMAGSLGSGNASSISVDGQHTVWQVFYQVNWTYLAVYLATWVVFFAAAVGGIVFKSLVIGPEVLGYVSSLTRDNPYVRVPVGGSSLDGMKRTKLLRGLRLTMKDVAGETATVGHVAISSGHSSGERSLEKGRLYL